MKKALKIIIIPLTFLFFTACGVLQVNERMYVQLMGINETDGYYQLAVQVYNPSESDIDNPLPEYKLLSSNGRSFYEAVDMIEQENGRELFFGHCTAVFMNESIAQSEEKLKMLAGERISIGVPIVFSRSPADDVGIKDEKDELIGADKIISALSQYEKNGLYEKLTLKELTTAAEKKTAAAIPLSNKSLDGTAIINLNGGVSTLSLSETAAFNLIRGSQGVRMSLHGASVTFDKADTSVYFQKNDSGGEYQLKMNINATLDEVGVSENIDDYEKEIEEILSLSATELFGRAYEEDFLNLLLKNHHSEDDLRVSFAADVDVNIAYE